MKMCKISKIFGVAVLTVLLCGCSLAKPEAGADAGKDHLVGTLITSEHLDLFDLDEYFEDHVSEIEDGEDIVVEKDSEYGQKLYATIDKKGSDDPSDWDITFGDIKGVNLLAFELDDDKGETYNTVVGGDEVCDQKLDVNISDDKEEISVSGTIYMIPGQADQDIGYYVNPVYQTADGDLYVTEGDGGFSTSGDSDEGVQLTKTVSNEVTVTENGKNKTEKFNVSVSFGVEYEPVKITVYQMDAEHHILKQQTYEPGKLPKKIKAEEKTAYFLVESEKKNLKGKTFVERKVYDLTASEDIFLETYYPAENGIMVLQETEIK